MKKLPATPRRFSFWSARRGSDVVGGEHRAGLDVVHRQHLGSHVEVHDVAGIVAIHEQHAGAAAGGLRAFDDRIGRRRGEDVADRAGVGQPLADEAEEGRLVPGSAADDQSDLAGTWAVSRDDRARASIDGMEMPAMSGQHADKHLLDGACAVIDKLLGLQFLSQERS